MLKKYYLINGEKIKFLPYVTGKRLDVAKVKSIYVMNDGDLPVNYRLKKNDNGDWKVFDIIIDGISLLKNYRTDFQNHVKTTPKHPKTILKKQRLKHTSKSTFVVCWLLDSL